LYRAICDSPRGKSLFLYIPYTTDGHVFHYTIEVLFTFSTGSTVLITSGRVLAHLVHELVMWIK
jgi:hypothetical protein